MTRPFHMLLAALVVLATSATGPIQPMTGQGVSSLLLIEEAVLSDGALTIPADGDVQIFLPSGVPETALAVEAFSFDPRAGIFAVRMLLTDGQLLGFRGQASVTVPASVPVRRLQPGEILTDADLEPASVLLATLPTATLRLSEDLVGKEVRRTLLPGRPVPGGSIQEPRAVLRGEKVKISYSHKGLDLSATGRALEDGALGNVVRVVNLSSNRTISAAVAGPGLVTVQ
ncbi:MAG: flagellar basal body P-ring formation chaperone FlgA [Pelagibaca sp.]